MKKNRTNNNTEGRINQTEEFLRDEYLMEETIPFNDILREIETSGIELIVENHPDSLPCPRCGSSFLSFYGYTPSIRSHEAIQMGWVIASTDSRCMDALADIQSNYPKPKVMEGAAIESNES